MKTPNCSCAAFEKLEGASVQAYVAAFLEDLGGDAPPQKNRYRCRVCGRLWEKRAPEVRRPGARPTLVRLS